MGQRKHAALRQLSAQQVGDFVKQELAQDGSKGGACCSKGAMPGTKSSAENSMVPSTLKCDCASGSRNSRKVVLKKAPYSS